MSCAIERFFRPGYKHELVTTWIPAIPGLVGRLERGIQVRDLGCGRGQSTVTMAEAWPRSSFTGVDYHLASIAGAMKLAHDRGLKNAKFVQAAAHAVSDRKYDLVCAFDCIHDMVDPVATLRAVRDVIADNGVLLWSEPNPSHVARENPQPDWTRVPRREPIALHDGIIGSRWSRSGNGNWRDGCAATGRSRRIHQL